MSFWSSKSSKLYKNKGLSAPWTPNLSEFKAPGSPNLVKSNQIFGNDLSTKPFSISRPEPWLASKQKGEGEHFSMGEGRGGGK